MFKSNSVHFQELRQFLDQIPIIETHSHMTSYEAVPISKDPIDFIMFCHAYAEDFYSVGGEKITGKVVHSNPHRGIPKNMPQEERYKIFLEYYKKSDKTAYARVTQDGLRTYWGLEDICDYEQFLKFSERLKERDESIYDKVMEDTKIKAVIVDRPDIGEYMAGRVKASKYCKFALDTGIFADLNSRARIEMMQPYLKRTIVCLDDYLEAIDNYFKACYEFGVVCLKNWSAYRRSLAYGNPTKAEAEKVFQELIYHPRAILADEQTIVLEDWIFHYVLRKAAEYDLPVQFHTGVLCDMRNDVEKANAMHLRPLLELHADVRFDLFHGNWPYMDEYLFLGKCYPNVCLDLVYAHGLDPLYCVELIKRAVMTIPHSKIFAFGGDTGAVEWVAAGLKIAKDNVAVAFAELIDSGWITMAEAKQMALDWFFNNPNEFYKLGFDTISIL